MDRRGVVSTSNRSQRDGTKVSKSEHSIMDRPMDKLPKQQFQARFHILNFITIQLLDKEALMTNGLLQDLIYFKNEQFVTGLHFPIPFLFKQFLHFSKIPPTYIHPNVIRILMGCSVLDVLYQLDLSLLEIIFAYTVKMSPKERFSLLAHTSFLHFVTSFLD